MKVGNIVKRNPRYWEHIQGIKDSIRNQIGIIVQYEKGPKWHHSGEYFVVMWSHGDGLDWKEPYMLEVISECG